MESLVRLFLKGASDTAVFITQHQPRMRNMNDRQFFQQMVKYSRMTSSPYWNMIGFLIFGGLMVLTYQRSGDGSLVFSLFFTLFVFLLIQGEVNQRIAREIVRLGDRIEELERRNP